MMADEPASPPFPMSDRPAASVPGHWLLARLGKKVLRPGGLRMTKALLAEAGIRAQRVVEFAPGMGGTASVVLDHDPAAYIGVDADPDAVKTIERLVSVRGRAVAARAEASGLPEDSADVVLCEGVLTIQSAAVKSQIVAEGARLLRPGSRYVLHELALRDVPEQDPEDVAAIRASLARAMHVNARPMTIAQWRELLEGHGLTVLTVLTAPLALLEPQRIVADEGLPGALRFARNVLRDRQARTRVRTMARTMRRHKHLLQAVGIVATRIEEVGP